MMVDGPTIAAYTVAIVVVALVIGHWRGWHVGTRDTQKRWAEEVAFVQKHTRLRDWRLIEEPDWHLKLGDYPIYILNGNHGVPFALSAPNRGRMVYALLDAAMMAGGEIADELDRLPVGKKSDMIWEDEIATAREQHP